MGSNPTLSARISKKPLEIGAFLLSQDLLPAQLPIHLQRSILGDQLPNPTLQLGLYPQCAASDADGARNRPALISLDGAQMHRSAVLAARDFHQVLNVGHANRSG